MELESWSQEVPRLQQCNELDCCWYSSAGKAPDEGNKMGMGQGVLSSLTISGGAHPIALNQWL